MSMFFNKGIYQLQWGPLKDQPNVGLYACSEGKVVVYNSEKPIEGSNRCLNQSCFVEVFFL